jgi:type VI secretion system protein ImpF
MVELSLRERLQPSLFDRLIDDERLLTIYELTFKRDELQRLGFAERDLVGVIAGQGLRLGVAGGPAAGGAGAGGAVAGRAKRGGAAVVPAALVPETASELLCLRFSAPHGRVGLSQLNAVLLTPPGAEDAIPLERLCEIKTHNILNRTAESSEQRFAVARRLRELVSRDLAILLNATCLEETVDLDAVPLVQRSVLNYGMPWQTGTSVSSVRLTRMARVIEATIRQFEPRLTKVRVAPETRGEGKEVHEISFRIDAEVWGQPAPHQIILRTRIDIESENVRVNDSGGR